MSRFSGTVRFGMLFWRRDASFGDGWITRLVICVGTAVAIVLALVLAPMNHALERLRVPSGLAALVIVVVTTLSLPTGRVVGSTLMTRPL